MYDCVSYCFDVKADYNLGDKLYKVYFLKYFFKKTSLPNLSLPVDKLYQVYFSKRFFKKTNSHNLSLPSDILVLLTLLLFYIKGRKENSKLVTKYDDHFGENNQ